MPLDRKLAAQDFVAVLLLLLLSIMVTDRLMPFGAATTPDSLAYLESARHVAAGNGIVLADRDIGGSGHYTPMTAWPPLYPLALSPFVTPDALDGPRRAALLSLLLLGATALACYAFFRRGLHPAGATIAAAAVCISAPVTGVFAYAWSETLFLPLLALATLLATIAASSRQHLVAGAALIGLALVLSLAFATRYAAWILGALVPVAYLLNRSLVRLPTLLFALALYAVICSSVIARNLALSNTLSGAQRATGDSLVTVLLQVTDVLALHVTPFFVLFVALVLAAATFLVIMVLARRSPPDRAPSQLPAWLAAAMAAAFLATMIAMSTIARFDPLDQRLLAPFLLLLLMATIAALPGMTARGAHIRAATCTLLAALIVVPGALMLVKVDKHWREMGSPLIAQTINTAYTNYTANGERALLGKVVATLAANPAVVYSDRPRIAEFITGVPALELPPGPLTREKIRAMKAQPNALLLVLHRTDEFVEFSIRENSPIARHTDMSRRGVLLALLDQSFPGI